MRKTEISHKNYMFVSQPVNNDLSKTHPQSKKKANYVIGYKFFIFMFENYVLVA